MIWIQNLTSLLRNIEDILRVSFLGYALGKVITFLKIIWFKQRKTRFLEIGPGNTRMEGFETINIRFSRSTDYLLDAAKRLPFSDNTFDVVYASHVLEHITWFRTRQVLSEWIRVLKPGGELELWFPDALKIAKAFVDAEISESTEYLDDGWLKYNSEKDPCVWFSGRTFSYGDGTSNYSNENWHHAAFTYRYIEKQLLDLGVNEIVSLPSDKNRGIDYHHWINMGVLGRKK